jgi:hypothetical protein
MTRVKVITKLIPQRCLLSLTKMLASVVVVDLPRRPKTAPSADAKILEACATAV